ncbi:MAG: DsbA family protein [Deltaproteobacteria bacterium]|nr:MAG: DsbA family protein [Deltaproteobacteria bacterium]
MAEPALAEFVQLEPAAAVVWRAFELRPEPVPALDPQGEYLSRVWRDHVYPLAAKMGMPLRLPPVQPRSRLAHEAAKWASSQGRFEEYNIAIFRTFFEHGDDIGQPDVLVRLAADIGLDSQSLSASLDNGEFTGQVLADEDEAQKIGVRAVPAFAANSRILATGVQTTANLQELIRRVPGL